MPLRIRELTGDREITAAFPLMRPCWIEIEELLGGA